MALPITVLSLSSITPSGVTSANFHMPGCIEERSTTAGIPSFNVYLPVESS